MDKREILESLNFGEQVAENEAATLRRYFVDTETWKQVFNGNKDVIYGPKAR